MAKLSKRIVLVLLICLTLPVITLLSLAATESGSRWLIRNLLTTTDSIHIAQIHGTLLDELRLEQLRYQDGENFTVTVADAVLEWRASALLHGHLHITTLQLNNIAINGQPPATEENDKGTAIPQIPLTISVDRLALNRIIWKQNADTTEVEQFRLAAKLEENLLSLNELSLRMPQFQVNAQSNVRLQSDWPMSVDLDWLYRVDRTTLNGLLAAKGNIDDLTIDSLIKGPVESEQKLTLRLAGEVPEFDLRGNWRKLQWPLAGDARVTSKRGRFQAQGTLQDYRTEVNAEIKAPNGSQVSFDFSGTGNAESLKIEQLLLSPAHGKLSIKGPLSWAQAIDLNLSLAAERLNPVDFGADVAGHISADAQIRGIIDGENIEATLAIDRLSGDIENQPLEAAGKLHVADRQIDIPQLHVIAGANRLDAQGRLSEQQADLDFTVEAPDLHSAWPAWHGNLNGKVSIQGSLKRPQIKTNLKGKHIRYQDNRIASLSLLADYEHESKNTSNIDLSVRNLQLAKQEIERIELHGTGNPDKHAVRLQFDSSLADLDVNVDGQWNGRQWLGEIEKLNIDHPQLKQWRLKDPAPLTLTRIDQRGFSIDFPENCLIQNAARLCASAQGSPSQQLDGKLSLTEWSLALTKGWLPEDLSLSGTLSAAAQWSSGAQGLSARAGAQVTEGKALLKDEDNVTHSLALSATELQLDYAKDKLESNLHLGLGEEDFITASLKAGEATSKGVRSLSGKVRAEISDMTFIDGLISQIRKLQGKFDADLQVSGNTEAPAVQGSARWRNGRFEIPRLGNTIDNIDLHIDSASDNPERILLKASLESGEGKLTADGYLDLEKQRNFPLHIDVQGEQVLISRLPEADVAVSPTLTIDKQDHLTNITGRVKIDKAQVEIKTLPESAVAPSEDEVIVTAEPVQRKKIDPSRLNAAIAIDFGDNSYFEGFGLKTRLSGQLDYLIKPNKQAMQGRAEMRDASYRAYGQDLTIRKGEFLFNGPADNPWLNIEAIRKAVSDNVTAVLSVTGPLKSPETRVFAEPALPESEALAYLVTGRSLQRLGKDDGSAVAAAAFNYGAGQLSWLSDQLGIDEFEFEQGEKIQDSAVRLGQYLNPDLYVGVTMGLFASKYAADLKYRLSEHFSVQTRAGETQRIELKYQLQTE